MIEAWRLVKKSRAADAFTGEGARRYGSRWSNPGYRAVYAADTLALAALELFVHLGAAHQGMEFAVFRVRIPERPAVKKVTSTNLPPSWRIQPAPKECMDVGSAWLDRATGLVLQVPSAVIPRQSNFLMNPLHPAYDKLKIERIEDFSFDPRMWKR